MIVSWCNTILQLIGGGLAYIVGQQMPCFGRDPCLSMREMWWMNVWVLFLVRPIYSVAWCDINNDEVNLGHYLVHMNAL